MEQALIQLKVVGFLITFTPLLHSWAYLTTLVIIIVHSSQLDETLDDFFLPSSLHCPFQYNESQQRGRELASQYSRDLSMSCDQYVWCFQLFNLLIL